ncbi:glycosyltransferase family 2 protein [Candidatus Peregrinibacteria bacterium]|nr:glycosyltransferase family 2 protein [Candidatus Peregrinibacteria bacterium]MBI3816803.1 glycosyltransferase family 2 protein [Candidatus Peregrinibacteria bacterium]
MLSLILPTYNEAQNLPELVPQIERALGGMSFEIIIVDDDSPDRTWKAARGISKDDAHVHVLRRIGRRGLSSAVIEGFLAAKGDVLAVMDADGQHDMGILPKLAHAVTTNGGLAIGSRYAEGGSIGQWDERRHVMSRFATAFAIRLCRVTVKDPMSGFFAIHRSTFEEVLPRLNPKGFKILLDLLMHVSRATPVREVPFTFSNRRHGESKLSRRVQIEFLEYLYEACLGRYVPLTFVKYCLVGALGVAVNLGIYLVCSTLIAFDARFLGLSVPLLAGIEGAILFNFLLNNVWTVAPVRLEGGGAILGFLRYNVACLFGAFANYAVTAHLLSRSLGIVPAVALGALVGMIWNYTMSRMFTWRV